MKLQIHGIRRSETQSIANWLSEVRWSFKRDNCKMCLGSRGGCLGNENVMYGVVVCDDCSVLLGRDRPADPRRGAGRGAHTARAGI